MEKLSKTAELTCPFCGSKRVRRSHPHAFVERVFLPFLRRRPFRCMDCYKRFYGRETTDASAVLGRPVISDPPKVKAAEGSAKPKGKCPGDLRPGGKTRFQSGALPDTGTNCCRLGDVHDRRTD